MIIFLIAVLALVFVCLPALVGALIGATWATDEDRRLRIEGRIEEARERIREALAHLDDAKADAERRIVDALIRESEERLENATRNGVVGAYTWCWKMLGRIWSLINGPEIEKAWPLAVAWGAGFYGAYGAQFGWAEPRPGDVLLLLTAALVFIASRPRRVLVAKATDEVIV